MKTPGLAPAVAAARKAAEARRNELAEARETVKRLEEEYAQAAVAVYQAQVKADAALPQCRLVRLRYREEESDGVRVVILRRTPSGMLVVRPVGQVDGQGRKFKWSPKHGGNGGTYTQAERQSSFWSDRTELRDVPVAYLPAQQEV